VSSQVKQVLSEEVDWSDNLLFAGIPDHLAKSVQDLCLEKGENFSFGDLCDGFLARNIDQIVEPPPGSGVEVRSLNWKDHAQLVTSLWKYADDQSVNQSKDLFERKLMLGVFVGDELAAFFCTTK